MRTNLENIRKVDEYLADELNASEKTAFEQELTSNHELQDLLDEQTLFIASVNRASLRSQIENVAGGSGFNFTKWLPVIVVGLMIASAAVWVSMPETNQLATVQEEISTVSKSESESPATINAPVTANEPVPVESSTAKPQRRYTPRAKIYECGGHKTWVAPDVQHFAVDPADGATIEGKDGILIIVPTDAFLDEKGDMVTTPVDFELVEALTLEDMVLYNLKTTSNGKMLESGGMFYANATSEGKPLQINPKRPLYIEIPTSDKQAGMQAFSSEIVDGEVNWVDPKPLQKFLVKVDLNELDFLPTGFADEVKINMPYKNHKTATEQLIDSLYYALGFGINATELSVDEEIIAGTYSTVKGVKGLKMWSGSSDMAIANLDTLATASCGVDPTAVQTIKQNTYANSFIATREFESRIIELHKLKNGQALLDLYVNNLGKNLWEVDQMASRDANSTGSKIFTKFSQEKLTNLKDANIYQSRLSAFYKMKQNELTKAKNKLVKELQQKNDAEIRALVKKYQKQREEWLKDQRSAQAKLPKPSAATSPVWKSVV